MLTVFLLFLAIPVRADTTAPTVPDSGRDYFPKTQDSFGAGLREVLKNALPDLAPDFSQAMAGALGVLAAAMLTGVLSAVAEDKSPVMELGGVVAVGVLMLSPARNSIRQGVACVEELTEYGRLLLPVMTSAMAAQGGVTAATALYAGTAVFTALLSTVISKFVVPMVYLFLALSVANGACGNLDKLRDLLKWLISWCLKALMMGFSAYMGITGVLSGSVDAAALKATKLAIGRHGAGGGRDAVRRFRDGAGQRRVGKKRRRGLWASGGAGGLDRAVSSHGCAISGLEGGHGPVRFVHPQASYRRGQRFLHGHGASAGYAGDRVPFLVGQHGVFSERGGRMMEALRQYVTVLTAAAILCAILTGLLGKKGLFAGIMRLLCGLVMMLCVFRFDWSGKWSDFLDVTDTIRREGELAAASGELESRNAIAASIKAQTEAYILDKAAELGPAFRLRSA